MANFSALYKLDSGPKKGYNPIEPSATPGSATGSPEKGAKNNKDIALEVGQTPEELVALLSQTKAEKRRKTKKPSVIKSVLMCFDFSANIGKIMG